MRDIQREILNQVATGSITAAEGAARLESLVEPAPPTPSPISGPPPAQGRAVKVISRFGSVQIVGDPSVAFAVADGAHSARQDGDTLTIEHSPFAADQSFTFGGLRRAVTGPGLRDDLTVRMNPDLALSVIVQAGNVRIEGMHGPTTGEVQAGNCTVRDFRGPIDLAVQAGDLEASGRLEGGASKCRCAMGSVRLALEKGSSVRITSRSTLGQIDIDGDTRPGPTGREVIVGSGEGTLDIECTMGDVKVIAH